MRGKSSDSFVHIADWYSMLCKFAEVDPVNSGTVNSQWIAYICGLLLQE